jgi:hypothetical protein
MHGNGQSGSTAQNLTLFLITAALLFGELSAVNKFFWRTVLKNVYN